jgi:predicted DNA-binding transcriptional regulator YafY
MTRATAVEKARRLNHARAVLERVDQLPEAAARMVRDCGISPRQAYRYLRHARRLKAPVLVGDAKVAFTVKLPTGLVRQVRAYARVTGSSLSDIVTRALTALLRRGRGGG